jgi:Uma2 family endonuclease
MSTPVPRTAADVDESADQRLVMHNVPWSAYEAQLALRGDNPVPRIAYLDGAMELMSPSRDHERVKSYLGRLLEAYAFEREIDLSPYGAWTLGKGPLAVGLEPDECYILGSDQSAQRPDLAIEVIWTRGGINKLEIYRRLGVPEVWFWREGTITVHVLRGDAYQPAERSACLPELDLSLLCAMLDRPTVMQAVRAFRAALRG